MLPVVRGDRATARQIVLYSLVLVGATLLPWGWGGAGPLYVVCALALGAVFVWLAERLRRDTSRGARWSCSTTRSSTSRCSSRRSPWTR